MSKIFGAGIDLIEISRINKSIKNKNFLKRLAQAFRRVFLSRKSRLLTIKKVSQV